MSQHDGSNNSVSPNSRGSGSAARAGWIAARRNLILGGVWEAVGVAALGIVITLSLLPLDIDTEAFPLQDKVEHAATYALLMAWFGAVYAHTRTHVLVGAALLCVGLCLEIGQAFLPYRHFDYWDLSANATGIIVGFIWAQTPLGRALIAIEALLPGARANSADGQVS